MTQVTRDPLRVRKVRGVSRPFGLRPKRIRILGGQIFYSRGTIMQFYESANPLLCFIYKMYVKRYVFKLEDSIM